MNDLEKIKTELERVLIGMRVSGFSFHSGVLLEFGWSDHRHTFGEVLLELIGAWWIDNKKAEQVVEGCPDKAVDPIRIGKLTVHIPNLPR